MLLCMIEAMEVGFCLREALGGDGGIGDDALCATRWKLWTVGSVAGGVGGGGGAGGDALYATPYARR